MVIVKIPGHVIGVTANYGTFQLNGSFQGSSTYYYMQRGKVRGVKVRGADTVVPHEDIL